MRVKRKCELCSNIATIFCESDQASLCNECDSKVHSANFLVAKHTRTLLCHVCQAPTLWTGSGPKFGPTISLCPTCLGSTRDSVINNGVSHDDLDEEEDDDDDDDDGDDDGFEEDDSHDDGDDDDDDENQVVPWSYSVSHPR